MPLYEHASASIVDIEEILKAFPKEQWMREILVNVIDYLEGMEEYVEEVSADNLELTELWNEIREENDELIAEYNELRS